LFIVLVGDMATYLGIGDNDAVVYADDSTLWTVTSTVSEAISILTARAARFVEFTKVNGLALNASKTQLLFSTAAKVTTGITIPVDGNNIEASNTIELLGVSYDRKMSTCPHDKSVAAAVRQRSSLIARLSHHVPRGGYLRQLALGLVGGKFSHALAAVAVPRLAAAYGVDNAPVCAAYRKAQIGFNDVARTLTGKRRIDHITIPDLLEKAKIPSINSMVVKAVAMEAWSAYNSCDGVNGARNPLGSLIFDGTGGSRNSRAAMAGKIQIPLRGCNTFAVHAAQLWNASPALRTSETKAAAKMAAAEMARSAPL
jgi:hypothetical protein